MPSETPKHIERSKGYDLPIVLCPRCNRAMSVKRARHDVKGMFGTTSKFFLKYNCKDCDTEWEEEEKPKEINGWAILTMILLVVLVIVIFMAMNG